MAKKKNAGCKNDFNLPEMADNYPLDETDKKLIHVLMNNGRMSNIEIAEKLGTSEATVRRRIDNLVNRGVIRGFSALLDNKKLGNGLKANVHIKVSSDNLDEIATCIANTRHACSVYRVIGRYNIYTELIFENIQSFQRYVDTLSDNERIEEFDYHIVTHAYKPCPWSGL